MSSLAAARHVKRRLAQLGQCFSGKERHGGAPSKGGLPPSYSALDGCPSPVICKDDPGDVGRIIAQEPRDGGCLLVRGGHGRDVGLQEGPIRSAAKGELNGASMLVATGPGATALQRMPCGV